MKHTKKITILHSNDLHGDFLAEQVDEKLVGGVSMLSGYIEKVRAEEPNTLYVIAGDMFRGSVIDSEYKGLSTIEIMNALAPDVVTIGNHEVDYGIAHLLFIEKCARFPIINANLYIKNTPTRLFTPYKILRVDGMNILFIGIITQDVINQTKSESLVGSFVDTAAAAAEVGKICNAHNSIDIDFTVLLTHIGFEEDRHLARQLDPAWGVDLIIGGHSHTLPEHAVEENGVVIAQAGTGTDQIGRFDIVVDTDNNCIDSYTWRTVPICAETCPRNPAMEQVLQRFTSQVDEKYSHIVGRFRRELTHPERTQETELGNLFADIFTRSLGIDVMLIGSGSIRAEKLGPIVTYGDLIEGFPYDDGVYMFKVTGRQLARCSTTCCGRRPTPVIRSSTSCPPPCACGTTAARAILITLPTAAGRWARRSAMTPCSPWACRTTTSKTSRAFSTSPMIPSASSRSPAAWQPPVRIS